MEIVLYWLIHRTCLSKTTNTLYKQYGKKGEKNYLRQPELKNSNLINQKPNTSMILKLLVQNVRESNKSLKKHQKITIESIDSNWVKFASGFSISYFYFFLFFFASSLSFPVVPFDFLLLLPLLSLSSCKYCVSDYICVSHLWFLCPFTLYLSLQFFLLVTVFIFFLY